MPSNKPEEDIDAEINLLHGRSYLRNSRPKPVTPIHAGVKSQPIPSKSVLHTPPPEVGVEDYEPEDEQAAARERRMTRLMLLALIVGGLAVGIGVWIFYLQVS